MFILHTKIIDVPISTNRNLYILVIISIVNMETKCVKLTLPKNLYEEGNRVVKEFGYSNLQDLTLEGLRKEIIELKKQQALMNLKKNFRSVKAKPLTKKQREKIAEEYIKTKPSEIFRKFNLD